MRTIGALVYEGFELLDLFGPLEMFGLLEDEFWITVIARDIGSVASAQGPEVVAEARPDAAEWDILLVPGGRGSRREVGDAGFLDMLRVASKRAGIVASVCTGSMLLGAAGLLEGRRATTNKLAFDQVAAKCPGVDWQRKARWVEDGRFWTSSGVSAGMDMSLALIRHLIGPEAADKAALWAEYVPNADPGNDPFAATGERS